MDPNYPYNYGSSANSGTLSQVNPLIPELELSYGGQGQPSQQSGYVYQHQPPNPHSMATRSHDPPTVPSHVPRTSTATFRDERQEYTDYAWSRQAPYVTQPAQEDLGEEGSGAASGPARIGHYRSQQESERKRREAIQEMNQILGQNGVNVYGSPKVLKEFVELYKRIARLNEQLTNENADLKAKLSR